MQLLGDAADNPDQRIADDIKQFIDADTGIGLPIGIGLLSSIVTLGSFVVILWRLSEAAPLHLFGIDMRHPGLSGLGGADLRGHRHRAHALIGWPLIALNFQQQRYEADFRFNLVRVRENSEQIALLAASRPSATGC